MSTAPSLRPDRFYCAVPYVTQDQFYKTNFLKCYDQTEKHPGKPAVTNGLRNLQSDAYKFDQIIQSIEHESDEHDVIRTYTSDFFINSQKFYNYINQQLCQDDMNTVLQIMPLIRRATRQINYHAPSCDAIVYRGMALDASQKSYFKKGVIFRFPGFTSTSISYAAASMFKTNTMFEIHIYGGCLQVRDIASVSFYPSEQEYLFSPYSLFEVVDVKSDRIVLKAIDNLSRVGM